ncbi:hypothetical protein E2C01_007448 [Portunus trituberculatus]|uniref:Uncharacterized protein n=1 Tax=Portunus trituberculatus TaxID=210409 RepID=A0A5B7CXY4_PORTR|nr:hypothetical protein [Portunus trituberculatus]
MHGDIFLMYEGAAEGRCEGGGLVGVSYKTFGRIYDSTLEEEEEEEEEEEVVVVVEAKKEGQKEEGRWWNGNSI